MKLTIVALLACLGIVTAFNFHGGSAKHEVKIADKQFLEKQKFLFEILYRVEDALMFEEYIKYGNNFVLDKSFYKQYNFYMQKFNESFKMGALLPKGEFFGALAKTHAKQAYGLFSLFYYAKDYETFMYNVCWARLHVNEGMFVYALTLAVTHRKDLHGLILPTIYEIFPQYFLNSKFIYNAEKFDYATWSKLIMYEKEINDVFYKNSRHYNNGYYPGDYIYMKDWKMWQWWKLMGLDEHFYAVEKFILRENSSEFKQDAKWLQMLQHVKMFYMPVDYTRDIELYNEESKLSYFTEDLGWNAYWYYLNMDYAYFLDGKTFGSQNDRRGEYWLYNVQQLMSRYYMERLSHGFGEIPEFSWFTQIEHGYDPQLIAYNGIGFSYRQNYWEYQTYGNFKLVHKIAGALQRIYNIIELGYYKTHYGHMLDLRKPASIEFIGNMLQGNADNYDLYFFNSWYMYAHMYFGDVNEDDMNVYPTIFMNFETMMRDPVFYMFHKLITRAFYRFTNYLPKYTKQELHLPGVQMKNVKISELVTYFDLVDFDVTNLHNGQMEFHDGQFVWDKSLFARQLRLNHQPFTFTYNIESNKAQKVVIHSFMAPKYDAYGRVISLAENRENFMKLDAFMYDLVAGNNLVKRNSNDYYWTVRDRTTYTELYYYLMTAYDGKSEFPLNMSQPHCGFPDRLLLPKGWTKGMPMQFFFMVTPYKGHSETYPVFDYTHSCGIGSGKRFIDDLPFGYPFDRTIDEYEFFVPNMYFKDAEIYHSNNIQPYYNEYENFGHFDYNYFNYNYTKYSMD